MGREHEFAREHRLPGAIRLPLQQQHCAIGPVIGKKDCASALILNGHAYRASSLITCRPHLQGNGQSRRLACWRRRGTIAPTPCTSRVSRASRVACVVSASSQQQNKNQTGKEQISLRAMHQHNLSFMAGQSSFIS